MKFVLALAAALVLASPVCAQVPPIQIVPTPVPPGLFPPIEKPPPVVRYTGALPGKAGEAQAAAQASVLSPLSAKTGQAGSALFGLPQALPQPRLSVLDEGSGALTLRMPHTTDTLQVGAAAAGMAGADYRRQADALLRRHPEAVEPDDLGQPAVRGEVAGLAIAPTALARARAAGFQVKSQERIAGLGLTTVVLKPPRGMSARAAIARLRDLDPAGRYAFNSIYFESGGVTAAPATASTRVEPGSGRGLRIGLVDGAASDEPSALANTRMVQQAFAPGGLRVTAHATAVASLLAGRTEGFRGAAPGATLYVADVYGATPAGGSALSVVRGLGWLAQRKTPVINISLVGPPNALLEAGVTALIAKGHVVVAAVGNDGPGAAPLYPAAYPGVVAVTGVDARRRVLPEAGRGAYVSFAAPGADMAAAGLDAELVGVRGTSFAAPLAAGRLARLLPRPDPALAQRGVEILGREASDLGAPGRDPVYGRGLVAFDLAVRPTRTAAASR